jgi:hypothetical protein
VSGSAQSLLIPSGSTHVGAGFNYQTQVDVQKFTAAFTFIPNGMNLAFVLQNNTNAQASGGGCSGTSCTFSAGAGCESGFYQAFDSANPPYPNNIVALELDSYSPLTLTGPFTYSSVQLYQTGQSPCLPNDNGPDYTPIDKISTSPVPLDSPANSQNTTTGHTYSVTLIYDGTSLAMTMYDVTGGGSCPGSSCFTQSWPIDIPSIVGGNKAYVGFNGATGITSSYPLFVDSFSYSEGI